MLFTGRDACPELVDAQDILPIHVLGGGGGKTQSGDTINGRVKRTFRNKILEEMFVRTDLCGL